MIILFRGSLVVEMFFLYNLRNVSTLIHVGGAECGCVGQQNIDVKWRDNPYTIVMDADLNLNIELEICDDLASFQLLGFAEDFLTGS